MDWLWTWGGKSFGFRDGDRLFTYFGLQVGQFYDQEVYGADGRYLGEVMSEDRLITHCSKKNWKQSGFTPVQSGGYVKYADYVGYVMYAGYEDFPSPDNFRK